MQLIAALIFSGILLIVLGAALYFANHQKPNTHPYSSWSNVLGPQFNGTAMDVRENLEKDIATGQHQENVVRQTLAQKRRKNPRASS